MRNCVGQVLGGHEDGPRPQPSAQPHLHGLRGKSSCQIAVVCILQLPGSFIPSCQPCVQWLGASGFLQFMAVAAFDDSVAELEKR